MYPHAHVPSRLQDQGNLLPEKEVLLIFRDTLMAVLYLHSRDPPIAHRRVLGGVLSGAAEMDCCSGCPAESYLAATDVD